MLFFNRRNSINRSSNSNNSKVTAVVQEPMNKTASTAPTAPLVVTAPRTTAATTAKRRCVVRKRQKNNSLSSFHFDVSGPSSISNRVRTIVSPDGRLNESFVFPLIQVDGMNLFFFYFPGARERSVQLFPF